MAMTKANKRINIGGTKPKINNKAVEPCDKRTATIEAASKTYQEDLAVMYADISKRIDELSIVMKQILERLPPRLNLDFLNK